MTDITSKNFSEKYLQIIDDLQSSLFISIDCEFSGLFNQNVSFFDSAEERYAKLCKAAQDISIIQMGISAFKYDSVTSNYNLVPYNFYIMPLDLLSNKLAKLTCEIASLKFLCSNNFDFNKLIYNGISYVNEGSETELINALNQEVLLSEKHLGSIQAQCSKVLEWAVNAKVGSETSLQMEENIEDYIIYALHKEIRNRFCDIWTYHEKPRIIGIKKITLPEKQSLLADPNEKMVLKTKLIDSVLGFSKVIKEIKKLKKPIVGHNLLLDLLVLYKQFFKPLPTSYKQFKQEIHQMFPEVYDTKYISYELKNILHTFDLWSNNSLADLYSYFKLEKKMAKIMYMPIIECKEKNFVENQNFHEGGFDSYCAGFCFIKMAYLLSTWEKNLGRFVFSGMPISVAWLFNSVTQMKNHINFPRGQVNSIILDGPDSKAHKHSLLFIESKHKEPLNLTKISKEIAKFASPDIILTSKCTGVMAVHIQRAKSIIEHFKDNRDFKVCKYNFFTHSRLSKVIKAGGILISVIFITALFKMNKAK